jgi:aminoglycoside phosphotransferase (APT) family kinase protein
MVELRSHLARLFPGSEIVSIEPLAPDTGATAGATTKAVGYGEPVRIELALPDGEHRELVWRTASANEYGHDRRADRVANLIQAYDDFAATPAHVAAIDVGLIRDGELMSLHGAVEPYLITSYARGSIYASDLRRIGAQRRAGDADLARLDALARYLVDVHVPISDGAVRYRRAIRDLIGSGEGIYGVVDGYPAHANRLREIEEACATWRWRLRDRHDRLTRTHGDFHPFNVVFDGTRPTVLDASRGACGDPADDVTAMAINFLLFAIDEPAAWPHGLGVLWRRWWTAYLAARPDRELLAVAPPFFAWRTLVVCNPKFYPRLSDAGRDKLLRFASDVLAAHVLDPECAEDLFA